MRLRSWVVAATAALLGWLVAVLLTAVVGVRPGWMVLLGAAMTTLALVPLYARIRGFGRFEVIAYTSACIVLEWPVLFLVTLAVAYWVGGPPED